MAICTVISIRGRDKNLTYPLIFSGEREHWRQCDVLIDKFDELINQPLPSRYGHVRYQIVEQAALPKQRMGSALGRVDL